MNAATHMWANCSSAWGFTNSAHGFTSTTLPSTIRKPTGAFIQALTETTK